MPDSELLYEQMIDQKEEDKQNFLRKCVDSEFAFVTLDRGIIFHVLRSLGNPLRVVAFKEDDFHRFFQDGTVISFKQKHEGCLAMHEGQNNILEFMKLNLPFNKYSDFEKWIFNQM